MPSRPRDLIPFSLCAVLCALFAAVAWAAVSGKSATIDEPWHSVTAWFNWQQRDFRLSPDVPPLWEEWIALAMGNDAIHFDPDSPAYRTIRLKREVSTFDVETLYETPGNDGVEIVRRGRVMALAVAVMLALLIARWAWQLGGPVAGVAAVFVYCWDPNFLGHGPLVKNDVAETLAYLAAAYAIWRASEKITWATALGVMTALAAAILVKFSGVLLAPVAAVVLGARAIDKEPWAMLGRVVAGRAAKLAGVVALGAATVVFTYAAIWAAYDFRFDSGPGGLRLDTQHYVEILRDAQVFNAHHRPGAPQELAQWQPDFSIRAMRAAEDHHLLPQAWIAGYLKTAGGAESRLCFINGSFYNGGRWYCFPLAALYKAPVATVVAVVLTGWIGLGWLRRGGVRGSAHSAARRAAIALIVPAAIYGLVAITSNVNIGLRHAFPIYPFVFIGVGLAAARLWAMGKAARSVVVILALALAAETASAFPNYINFFSLAFDGPSAGFNLLSDSNLDWGQDLPLLADWQKAHADQPLYLDYFGRCDPAAYGIRYQNLQKVQGVDPLGGPPVMPDRPGVIAVSATDLHLVSAADPPPPWYGFIRGRKADWILGDTLYLYRIDPAHPIK